MNCSALQSCVEALLAEFDLAIGAASADGAGILAIVGGIVFNFLDRRLRLRRGGGVGALEIGAGFGGRDVDLAEHAHGDQLIARAQPDTAHARWTCGR